MLKAMPRWASVAVGALVALIGVALLFLGAAWLAPRFLDIATRQGTGRTTVIAVLVACVFLLQVRRWQAARARKRQAPRAGREDPSPLNLTSGM